MATTMICNNKMRANLTSSALRIYLTHLLQQTENILESCRFQMSSPTCRRILHAESLWEVAVTAAVAVKKSIEVAQQSAAITSRIVGNLTVIESLQDSLREALHRARKNDEYDEQNHSKLSSLFSARAQYLTFGIKAETTCDSQLASLWFQAAQKLYGEIELLFDFKSTDLLCNKTKKSLRTAVLAEEVKRSSEPAQQIAVYAKVRQHTRYAAAFDALDRTHSHDYAAELFMETCNADATIIALKVPPVLFCRTVPVTPAEITLWEEAAASWQLVAELVAAQASQTASSILRKDSVVQSMVRAAEKCVIKARSMVELLGTVENGKKALVKTRDCTDSCRDPSMLPVWRALATHHAEAVTQTEHCFQCFVDGKLDPETASKMMSEIAKRIEVSTDMMHQTEAYNEWTAYYKNKAAQAQKSARFPELAGQCWTRAARHTDDIARICAELIVAGEPFVHTEEHKKVQRFRQDTVNHSVSIVENVLGTAVEYLDKARGAEAGERVGRDPREAQMWRKAAGCLGHKAELMWEEMETQEKEFDPSRPSNFKTRTSAAVEEIDAKVKSFQRAATYLQLAYKHRALPGADMRQNGTRCAILYERVSELVTLPSTIAKRYLFTEAISVHLILISDLNSTVVIGDSQIVAREMLCEYRALACTAAHASARDYWTKAADGQVRMLKEDTNSDKVACGKLSVMLFVRAAQESDLCTMKCVGYAAAELDRTCQMKEGCKLFPYQLVLTKRILALAQCSLLVDPLIPLLSAEENAILEHMEQQGLDNENLTSMVEEHVQCVMHRYQCETMFDTSSTAEWSGWQIGVNLLHIMLKNRAKYTFIRQDDHRADLSSLMRHLSFQLLVVQCCESLARAVPSSVEAEAWEKAVRVCHSVNPTATDVPSGSTLVTFYDTAIAAVERAMQEAQGASSG